MLTFLLGMATGALVIVIGVLIVRAVDERRDERTRKRSREMEEIRQSCQSCRKWATDMDILYMHSHEEKFHKKGKK